MRILFCNYEYPPLGGGGGVATSLIANELAKRHEVTVLTTQAQGLPSKQAFDRVQIIRVPVIFRKHKTVANLLSMMTFIPMAVNTGKRLFIDNGYDLINTHFVLPTGPVGDYLARFAAVPNVLTLHGGDLYDPSKFVSPHRNLLLRSWISRLLRRADAVVGNSSDTLENMRCYYTPEIEGIRIALGIKDNGFDHVPRIRYGFSDDELLMVTIGRLIARKSIIQLIEVVQALKGDKIRLLILGDGPQERSLKHICAKKHLRDKIIFFGFLDESEKFKILRICDLFVSTSQHEGFGLAFLEAMQSGLPIVCYDKGGQNDFLKDQETGYLVRLNDINQFTSRCEILINNRELRERIGEANRVRAREFHIDRCAALYEDVFAATLSRFGNKRSHNANANPMRRHSKDASHE